MNIKLLDTDKVRLWDEYVEDSSEATFFHKAGWKEVVERSFGHKTYYLYAEDQGKITGILPMVHINSLLFGNALCSNAFCVYGGVVADNVDTALALDRKACEIANELGVDYLEMRNQSRKNQERPVKELYVTFRKELHDTVDDNMQAIPRKQRAMIRKGIKAGLISQIDEHVDRFYQAYSESVRNLGTPVFSKKYFQVLRDVFGKECEILTILDDQDRLISSVMNFYFKNQVLPYYGGGTEQARSVQGNDFMYWEVMRRAVEKGIKVFDYGRSKEGTGSYRFKKHWGFEPEPLFYEFHLVKSQNIPDINPLNPKYQFFIAAWKKLPLPVSQWIGPWLSRDLG